MKVEDKTLKALEASLNFRKMRHDLITSNIANAETPNYKAKKIEFEEALARALDTDGQMNLKTTSDRHYNVGNGGFQNLEPEIYEDPNGIVSLNGNTVDRDKELAEMAENKILSDATVNLINKKLALMKYVVGQER